jgi:hypothetical protein
MGRPNSPSRLGCCRPLKGRGLIDSLDCGQPRGPVPSTHRTPFCPSIRRLSRSLQLFGSRNNKDFVPDCYSNVVCAACCRRDSVVFREAYFGPYRDNCGNDSLVFIKPGSVNICQEERNLRCHCCVSNNAHWLRAGDADGYFIASQLSWSYSSGAARSSSSGSNNTD